MKLSRFIKIYYFIIVILSIYNWTNPENVSLENAMILGHYSSLIPNMLLFIYIYYVIGRFVKINNLIIVRVGMEEYKSKKEKTVMLLAIVYLVIFYVINYSLYQPNGVMPGIAVILFVCLNSFQILLSSIILLNYEQKYIGLLIAIGINLLFHYIIISVLYPMIFAF